MAYPPKGLAPNITDITYSGTATTDPVTSYVSNGVTYSVAYNGAGLIATITGSDGSLRTMTYNGNNQLTSDVTT